MTDHRCVICHKTDPADGWTCCGPCAGRLDDDLAAIVVLTRAAAGHLVPLVKPGGSGGGKPGSRPPLDVGALDDAQGADVLPLVESWERAWREHAGMSPYGPVSLWRARGGRNAPPLTLTDVVGFLRANLALMLTDAGWPIEELQREVHDARRTLDRHDDTREPGLESWSMKCPADHPDADGRLCAWRIYVAYGRRDIIACQQCGTQWEPGRLLHVALATEGIEVWAYPKEIEAILGIPARTLRQWATDGHVKRKGSRYDIGAVTRRIRAS